MAKTIEVVALRPIVGPNMSGIASNQELIDLGYTHEYGVWHDDTWVRIGVTSGMSFEKLRKLICGESVNY